jgi:ribose transport system permease protein
MMTSIPTDTPPAAGKSDFWIRARYKYIPDHLVGEILSKPWIDTAIPTLFFVLVLVVFAAVTPSFFAPGSLSDLVRIVGEYQFIAIGAAIVMIAGGIDLSVGSVFAMCNLAAILLVYKYHVHVLLALTATVLVGAVLGSINGFLIGYLRLRAFLTTLVTLIIWRAVNDIFIVHYTSDGISSRSATYWARLQASSSPASSPSRLTCWSPARVSAGISLPSAARDGWRSTLGSTYAAPYF